LSKDSSVESAVKAKEPLRVCETCFGPLEIVYDYDAIANAISREKIARRDKNPWRYRELLPIDGEPQVGMYSGFTPLVKAHRLAEAIGVKESTSKMIQSITRPFHIRIGWSPSLYQHLNPPVSQAAGS
jgi:threonine synthase